MIRTNLSTRPFYNERAAHLWIGLVALVVVAATLFNVSRVLRYSGSNTELATQASRDEAGAVEARRNATRLRAGVDAKQVDAASVDARQANELIDRRTFSWTELFNRFEATLPNDVRITSVSPKVDRARRTLLTVAVLARTVDDVNQFMERLDTTGAFRELRSTQERNNDDDQIESILEMVYLPGGAPSATEAPSGASSASTPRSVAPASATGARR